MTKTSRPKNGRDDFITFRHLRTLDRRPKYVSEIESAGSDDRELLSLRYNLDTDVFTVAFKLDLAVQEIHKRFDKIYVLRRAPENEIHLVFNVV